MIRSAGPCEKSARLNASTSDNLPATRERSVSNRHALNRRSFIANISALLATTALVDPSFAEPRRKVPAGSLPRTNAWTLSQVVSPEYAAANPAFALTGPNGPATGYVLKFQVQAAGEAWTAPIHDVMHTVTSMENSRSGGAVDLSLPRLASGKYEARCYINGSITNVISFAV